MLKPNRLFILTLVLTLLLTMVSVPVLTGAQTEGLTAEELGLLERLGITDGEYQPDAMVTRGALVRAAVGVLGVPPAKEGEAVFYDVAGDHPYYGDIKTAADAGLVSGYDNRYFYPEQTATVADALKVLTHAAGYADYVKLHGGGEGGYISTAAYLSVASDMELRIPYNTSDKLSWEMAARLLFDTLHARPMVQTGFGDKVTFEVLKDSTVMEENLHLIYGEGIVKGANYTTLTHPDASIAEDTVLIGEQRFTSAEGGALLGQYVRFYHYEQKDVKEPALFYLYADPGENSILVLDAADAVSFEDDKLYYITPEGKTVKITFDEHPDFICNGIAYATYKDDEVIPGTGQLTLIDNDDDGNYDLISTDDYDYLYVGATSTEEMAVYDKFDEARTLRLDDSQIAYKIYRAGGKDAFFGQIIENQLLAVRKSKNTDGKILVRINIINETATGAVTSLGDDYVTVADRELRIGGRIWEEKDAGRLSLSLGTGVILYVHNGVAVMGEYGESTGDKLGYLIDASRPGNSVDTTTDLLLAVDKAQTAEYKASSRIRIDDVVRKTAAEVYAALEAGSALTKSHESYPVAQPVIYRLNADNEVSYIITAAYSGADASENGLSLDRAYLTTPSVYQASNRSFYDKETGDLIVSAGSDTRIIHVPDTARNDKRFYNFLTDNPSAADNSNCYIEVYNLRDNLTAKYIFLYLNIPATVPASAAPAPVTGVTEKLNADGEAIKAISVYENGKIVQYPCSIDLAVPALSAGDVVRYRLNNAREISAIQKVLSPKDAPPPEESRIQSATTGTPYTQYDSTFRSVYGTAYAKDGSVLTVTTGISEDENGIIGGAYTDNFRLTANPYVYVYNGRLETPVRQGSVNDIMTYAAAGDGASRLYLHTNAGTLRMIYIVE